jgi:prophage DNA circulation protein
MSGLQGITGLPTPNSLSGFLGALQAASFRGVPFLVDAAQVRVGRRQANHEYPFRDGGWPEDMGRAQRTYTFTGHLIGDLAPAMQLALNTVLELPGSGLLIHPAVGAVKVAVVSGASGINWQAGRLISLELVFLEDTGTVFPSVIIATVLAVAALAITALAAANADLGGVAGPAVLDGSAVTGEGGAVVAAFAQAVAIGGGDPTAIVGMATALPPPDSNTTYGRYAGGSASVALADGTTVAVLQAQLATQRAAVASTGASAVGLAGSYSAATDMMDALAAIVEAMRAGISDPADQVRVLLGLAGFAFSDGAGGPIGLGAAMATMRDAMAAACRRAALVSLALASSAYQPVSYDDAAALRVALAAALDTEILAAGDAGEDASYVALKQLRAGVILDLTVRGANLPAVVTVNFRTALPSLAIAQMLYRDASRSDEIAAESGAIHPAFCPISFQALAT